MKQIQRNVVFALMVLMTVSAAIPSAKAGDVPKTKAECLSIAEKYEKLAVDQVAIIQEHKDMKQHYRLLSTTTSLPKQSHQKNIAEMDKHCDAIIASAQKLADEYRALAQWHRIHGTTMME